MSLMDKVEAMPLWGKIVSLSTLVVAAAALGSNVQAWAESEWNPFALKYQVASQFNVVTQDYKVQAEHTDNTLQLLIRRQTVSDYKALGRELNDLRTQRLMLKESIQRETDLNDLREKTLRLDSIEQLIASGDKEYLKLRCQVEGGAACN